MTASRLTIDGLSAGYGQYPVTFDVTVEVNPGEIVALLGPNGAGKSTTLLAASGLVRTFSGTIHVDGVCLDRTPGHVRSRSGLVQVPEDRSLFFDLSVDQNLALAAATRRPSHAYDVFPQLASLRSRRAGVLSGGEQQMLAIGRGFEMSPRYLMIDEMSLGLAPIVARRVLTRLEETVRERDVGLLLVEQNVDLAFEFADRVYLVAGGRVRYSGTRAQAAADWPSFRAAYFG